MTRQTVAGPLTARHLGAGVWHLTTDAAGLGAAGSGAAGPGVAGGSEVFLHGLDAEASELLQREPIAKLRLEWRTDRVTVVVHGSAGVRHLSAMSATVHESQPRLYEMLPLAVFDSQAQQFWRRVFRLMRIPGGRFLLKFIARREPPKIPKQSSGGPESP